MATTWKCPKCGAPANRCGKGECLTSRDACMGLICECEGEIGKKHGEDPNDPCHDARCHHCGWAGTMPATTPKLKGWAKTAWDAGWRPPKGWQP